MTKEKDILDEAESMANKVSNERFRKVCKEVGVTRFGVTGIDLSKPCQISKVTAAILTSTE